MKDNLNMNKRMLSGVDGGAGPSQKKAHVSGLVNTTTISGGNGGGLKKSQQGDDNLILSDTPPSTRIKDHTQNTGHRPVTSCTHCRQHKIKCNASDNFPDPCSRCDRMGLNCEIDPQFRPKKGSQLQNLRKDVDDMKLKIENLLKNDSVILNALKSAPIQNNTEFIEALKLLQNSQIPQQQDVDPNIGSVTTPSNVGCQFSNSNSGPNSNSSSKICAQTYLAKKPPLLNSTQTSSISNAPSSTSSESSSKLKEKSPFVIATTSTIDPLPSPYGNVDEFVLGEVRISIEKANYLHDLFVAKYLPYFPIMTSVSAQKLFDQSQLLFWTVMLTACLSEPEPTLYNKLAKLIKQLAIETCWLRTPRSTHISQALLILCTWPLPNQKILDDCSYRFVGLAKSLSLQLGLHRGEFISEFTRSQTSLPNAEKWRTRTWLGIFFSEVCWASTLGLPSTSQIDYLVEQARNGKDEIDKSKGETSDSPLKHTTDLSSTTADEIFTLPNQFRRLICLSHFQSKLYSVIGSSISTSDGLLEPRDRASAISLMDRELKTLNSSLNFTADKSVEIYYLYVKLTICCFAFLPETPRTDQTQYITEAYLSATRVVTLLTQMLETQQLIELPIYVRQSVTYAALILFKLQLTPLMTDQFIDSVRQSIVTVHRLYRNQLTAWATKVENDISRTASVLEKLNFVLITHPEVFVEADGIISRMRSHLTGSLFYDLVWCVHEARRREMDPKYNEEAMQRLDALRKSANAHPALDLIGKRLFPLPFYNQISREDFKTISKTTPGGTTVTKLVPTQNALKQAKEMALSKKNFGGAVMEINGIPLSMLNETGSVNLESVFQHVNNPKYNTVSESASVHYETPVNIDNQQQYSFTRSNIALNLETSFPQSSSDINSSNPKNHLPYLQDQTGDVSMQRSNSIPAPKISVKDEINNNSKPIYNKPNVSDSLFSNMSNYPQNMNKELNKVSNTNTNSTGLNSPNSGLISDNNNSAAYAKLNQFLQNNGLLSNTNPVNKSNTANISGPNNVNSLSDLDNFFLQQSTGWLEGNSINDDFLGWFDMNMEPEF
ncbi:hypothetical protein Kpol_1018p92 [Vanderwaltozyma polyspora DSM 70294]|uniref:Zn(2)-C6 fungal-type domain-containing protein n=1 Tax=Vanderwaltozyma polyspora (strain ATCC 22028 / DSM 70294 / BCRC 21397 / CBS 2163 / NBRC 10782 / NRRL Y-8283 / UCD 57-17) TaxID=436907 RepID=A7TDT9_VANPO|nr:uncharacterized protein Kpol_1018p92 [Vanderwaltozyma polyspora DSM 70294]EDO19559.1 hypothetical protein Kpol_1018p92 [Vanderwaltozyma polyspora DSM 70294]